MIALVALGTEALYVVVLELKAGEIKILTPIFFATDKDIILPKSFPVLQAVADVLRRWMRRSTSPKNLGFFGMSNVEKGQG